MEHEMKKSRLLAEQGLREMLSEANACLEQTQPGLLFLELCLSRVKKPYWVDGIVR